MIDVVEIAEREHRRDRDATLTTEELKSLVHSHQSVPLPARFVDRR